MDREILIEPGAAPDDVVIIGVVTDDAMRRAGAEVLIRAGVDPEAAMALAEEVHFAMRQAAGEGRALRRRKGPRIAPRA